MKKISSFLSKLSNKNYLKVWLAYHLGLFAFFALVFCINPSRISIDADLFNMFPRPFEEEGIRNADEKLTENVGQNVFILVSHQDFSKAKEAAEENGTPYGITISTTPKNHWVLNSLIAGNSLELIKLQRKN